MKKLLTIIACSFFLNAFSQNASPTINYQAIIKDAQGNVYSNASIGVEFRIGYYSNGSNYLYSETHTTTTTSSGQINLLIGTGNRGNDGQLAIDLDWTQQGIYLTTLVTIAGTTTSFGTDKLNHVPFAISALTVVNPVLSISKQFDNFLATTGSPTTHSTAYGQEALRNNQAGGQANTAIGSKALRNNTTGSSNAALGHGALQVNTTGSMNSGFGHNALHSNTTGSNNVGIGPFAVRSNTTGANNVGLGYSALYKNTTGGKNVALGNWSLYDTTTGVQNTAVGHSALVSNTTGTYIVAVGKDVLKRNTTGYDNTAIGNYAMSNITTGYRNTAIGIYAGPHPLNVGTVNSTSIGYEAMALASNTIQLGDSAVTLVETSGVVSASGFTGDGSGLVNLGTTSLGTGFLDSKNNVVIGTALSANVSGTSGVAIGANALNSNTTGDQNNAVGYNALTANTTGIENVAFGYAALAGNTTGEFNVGLGNHALQQNTTGDNNTSIGYGALEANTTASNNVAVGTNYLLQKYKYNRVAIIDFDVHHGNGTQNIFYNNEKVLYISSHQYPYYPGSGAANDKGNKNNILNVPLNAGTKSHEFLFNRSITSCRLPTTS